MRRLLPTEMFPAGATDIRSRVVSLSNGLRMRIAESGDATAPAVLMLHGWCSSLYSFRHALQALPRAGFRAIAADLRGFGLSDKPTAKRRHAYTREAYREDLDALIDTLEIHRPSLVGHSFGGAIALDFALRQPDRVQKLALINPIGLFYPRMIALMRALPPEVVARLGVRAVPRWLVAFILRHIAYGDPDLVTEQTIDEYWAPTQFREYGFAACASAARFDWRPLSPTEKAALAVPTLVILGRQDRLVRNDEAVARTLANARAISFPGGHCVHEERPAEVYGAIEAFLR